MNQKKETTVLLLSLLITISALAGGAWWLTKDEKSTNDLRDSSSVELSQNGSASQPSTISTGNNILISQDSNPEKQAAASATANKNYSEAVSKLELSLKQQRNDPEALIYLNNARIGDGKNYTIAVPVPISTEVTTAKEILRGVAQAQQEINQQGGIDNIPLKVAIVDDRNNPETAKEIAASLVQNESILGVVGHFSSGVTLAVAPIYQENGLVAISATSTSIDISNMGNYIFRTVASDRFTSNALGKYFLEKLQKNKAAIVYNSQSAYSQSLRNTFTTDLVGNGGEVVIEADLAQDNFNAAETIEQAGDRGAEVLVFLNDSKTAERAYLLMQLNDLRLPMLGGDSLYKPQTLQNAGEKASGLVLGVPWHIAGDIGTDFPASSRRLWGGDVNWRTAMAYDATKALIAGLDGDPSRRGIQKTLSQANFSFLGASGKVNFLASGDRNKAIQLVTVRSGNKSSYGYDFVPLE